MKLSKAQRAEIEGKIKEYKTQYDDAKKSKFGGLLLSYYQGKREALEVLLAEDKEDRRASAKDHTRTPAPREQLILLALAEINRDPALGAHMACERIISLDKRGTTNYQNARFAGYSDRRVAYYHKISDNAAERLFHEIEDRAGIKRTKLNG